MKLVLFDIDGTLLQAHGRGKNALIEAMEAIIAQDMGRPLPDHRHDFARSNSIAGKTDLQFVFECLEPLSDAQQVMRWAPRIFARHTELLRHYFSAPDSVRLLPGVQELLQAVLERQRRKQCVSALLTGNIAAGAEIKLGVAGLTNCFVLGAYGDEGRMRSELPPLAVKRARERYDRDFTGHDVVIVGDTPADIECGRPLGVRTLAVATGPCPAATLAAHRPDYLFESLADTEAVLAAIFAP